MGARYEVEPATLPEDRFPVYHVLRLDLVDETHAPKAASRYYQVRWEPETLTLYSQRLDERPVVVRRTRIVPHHHDLWCSCGYTTVCPHRALWHAMGLPEAGGVPAESAASVGSDESGSRLGVGRVD